MTFLELKAELAARNALIVHCSRPGKGGELKPTPLYPADLRATIGDLDANKREACCSVIWPGHEETYGDIGIVISPRSLASIESIHAGDGGSSWDEASGRRIGLGKPFSAEGVQQTFFQSVGHNEWVIRDADVVGLYVNLAAGTMQIARELPAPAGLPAHLAEPAIFPDDISFNELREDFPLLPIYVFEAGTLRQRIANNPYA